MNSIHSFRTKLPSISKRYSSQQRLTSSERRRNIERNLSIEMPNKNNIVIAFANIDKDLDVIIYKLS